MELAEEARGRIWTGGETGRREAYQAFKDQNPAIYPRQQQYEVIPGESGWEGMASGARANWLKLNEVKAEIYSRYQKKVDDLLKKRPWDTSGRRELLNQRYDELNAAKEQYPLPPITEDLPAVLYGMNPKEMWDSSVEDVVYELEATGPQVDDYKDAKGVVDWGAYYDDRDEWLAGLPKGLPGVGTIKMGTYQGLTTAEAIDAIEKKNHSPLEAAALTYQEAIAAPAWDRYRELDDAWESQWPGIEEIQSQYYEAGPKGSQARRDYLKAHPELKEYWDWKEGKVKPYDATVGRVGEMNATDLIPVILARYKGRGWTEAELRKVLDGVVFPPLSKQSEKKNTYSSSASGSGARASSAKASSAGIPYWSDYYPGLENENWRSVVGKPWWEKYPRKSYGGKTTYSSSKRRSNYAPTWDGWDDDNEWTGRKTNQVARPPEWQYRRTIYGGPQWA